MTEINSCVGVCVRDFDFQAVDFALTPLDFDIQAGRIRTFVGFRGSRGLHF